MLREHVGRLLPVGDDAERHAMGRLDHPNIGKLGGWGSLT